jgi:hypothetical protein
MTEPDLAFAAWRKSSRSGSGTMGDCIEVAAGWRKSSRSGSGQGQCVEAAAVRSADRVVAMRDSKNPDGAVLCFSAPDWTAFLSRIKTGALDLDR